MTLSLHMSAISLLFGLLLGIVVGVAIGYLYARGRLAAATADASARARAAEQRHRGHHLDALVAGCLHEVDDGLAGITEDMPNAGLEKALAGFGARSRPLIVEARIDPSQYVAQF